MRRDEILLQSTRSDSLPPAGDSVWWRPGKKSYDDIEQVSQFFAEYKYIDDGRRKLLNFDSKQIEVGSREERKLSRTRSSLMMEHTSEEWDGERKHVMRGYLNISFGELSASRCANNRRQTFSQDMNFLITREIVSIQYKVENSHRQSRPSRFAEVSNDFHILTQNVRRKNSQSVVGILFTSTEASTSQQSSATLPCTQ